MYTHTFSFFEKLHCLRNMMIVTAKGGELISKSMNMILFKSYKSSYAIRFTISAFYASLKLPNELLFCNMPAYYLFIEHETQKKVFDWGASPGVDEL